MFKALCFLITFICIIFNTAYSANTTGGTTLPYRLYLDALTESPEYDEDLDYIKHQTTNIQPYISSTIYKGLIDKVVVKKSLYRMYLYKGSQLVQSFLIALGPNPKGPKISEGDKRTPEGKYTLDYIKKNSRFYRAFHISYPNINDIKKAKALGLKPGSMIMVHGQPNIRGGDDDLAPGIQSSNWTNGCIALMNFDMDKFLELVDPGTEIIIEP